MLFSRLSRNLFRAALWALALILTIAPALADERILSYHSDIKINKDASITVLETIMVRSEGEKIRRGIYRDFPTRYKDRLGNRYKVNFQVLDVRRGNNNEAFHTENRSNGVRVYLGSANTLLAPGDYEYQLLYRTTRQLGYFDEFDELYWNVTGNGWDFAIDQASAQIELPAVVAWDDLKADHYTGRQGSSGKNAEFRITSSKTVDFKTTAGLGPREGLTIALSFPKGIVHEPTSTERLGYFLTDNASALVLLIGLLLPLAWYLRSWHNYGRDPAKGVIIPRFKPPEGLSPAACRYVKDMGFRSSAFTAAIISLAVKGHLKIDEKDKDYTLYRSEGNAQRQTTAGEAAVLEELLPERDSWIELDDKNHSEFQHARSGLNKALKAEYKGQMFKLNTIHMLPAAIMSVLAVVFAISRDGGPLPWVIFIILTIAMHMIFLFLLKAPTPAGRRVMDEIEGFKMYLDTAEKDRLDRMRSPELTPEVFEMFLPYAFALGVQNNWCKRFASEFPREIVDQTFQPAWYSGRQDGLAGIHHLGSKGFSNSFTTAISSASSPPGSSSGSGGGGFSGGGGGGGGGGGW
jgi:uncharacterized protein (TIGR04222 family)